MKITLCNFALCNNSKNGDCRWFFAEMTVLRSNPEDPEFVPLCSGIFVIWWIVLFYELTIILIIIICFEKITNFVLLYASCISYRRDLISKKCMLRYINSLYIFCKIKSYFIRYYIYIYIYVCVKIQLYTLYFEIRITLHKK